MNGQNEGDISHTPGSWHFGPDWPGQRCEAKTRRGTLCQKPALRGRSRCQLHGGRAGAPTGPRNGAWRHGRYCQDKLASDRAALVRIRHLAMICKLMKTADKLTAKDPARAKLMWALVHGEINRFYELAEARRDFQGDGHDGQPDRLQSGKSKIPAVGS